jgi:cytidyltransferase-like protein
MIKVAVAGGWDPLHIGHVRHIEEASKLGDWLVVLVSSDEDMVRKKGMAFMPLNERVEILKALRWVDEVVVTIDKDGTMAETLKIVKPNIFAKGGDRTPDNMPTNEVEACKEIDCEIVYGVGKRLQSSSALLKRVQKEAKSSYS